MRPEPANPQLGEVPSVANDPSLDRFRSVCPLPSPRSPLAGIGRSCELRVDRYSPYAGSGPVPSTGPHKVLPRHRFHTLQCLPGLLFSVKQVPSQLVVHPESRRRPEYPRQP